jgi:hypothetical protein
MKEILKITNYEKELEKKGRMIEYQIEGDKNLEENLQDFDDEELQEGSLAGNEEGEKDLDDKSLNLSDIEDEEIEQYILTKEESAMKSIIWHHIHKEWLDEQEIKERKRNQKSSSGVRRKKKSKELVNAPDAVTAILNHSKIGSKINHDALNRLFEDSVTKKLKTEGAVKSEKAEDLDENDLEPNYERPLRIPISNIRSSRIEIKDEERRNMTME